jgi:hypothetical protein
MQHLGVLEEAGLVRSEKIGRVRTCTIEPRALSHAEQWINARRQSRRIHRFPEVRQSSPRRAYNPIPCAPNQTARTPAPIFSSARVILSPSYQRAGTGSSDALHGRHERSGKAGGEASGGKRGSDRA